MTIKVTYNVTDVYMSQSVSPVYINVSYSDGGASGGGVWGTITGTLSNQTDLQTALDLKVPYSGATGNVNLGEYELKAGQLTLDTTPTGTAAVGTTRWNDTIGATETTLKGGSVVLKNGVDLVARVVNKVSPNTTLTKAAYQAVRISGAQGQRLAVALAQANNDTNSADTIGLVTETIATNQEGFIMTMGQLEGINTTGSLQGETWVDGDVLYLSPTTAGALTNIKPTGSGHIVVIGYVEYAHVNNGKIYTKVMNGWELDELHDVDIISPANNEALIYESSTSLWKNKTIATALGFTPVPTSRTITINGVTFDLSADRTYTVAAGISGSGAAGQVTYWTGASAVTGSADLTLDTTLGRLNLTKSVNGTAAYYVTNASTGASAIASYSALNGTNTVSYGINGTNTTSYGALTANNGFFYSTRGIVFMADNATNGILQFATGGNTERMRIDVNGNVGIGVTPTVRLQVAGDTLLRGSGATNATTALTVQNSSSTNLFTVRNDGNVGIGTASPAVTLDVQRNSAALTATVNLINQSTSGSNFIAIGQNTTTQFMGVGWYASGGATYRALTPNTAYFYTSSSAASLGFNTPTNAIPIIFCTDDWTERVRISGTGNLGIGTTPTALTDIGASTTTRASLRIRSGTAPTSPNDGDIWFDGTDIKMRIGGVTKTFTLV